MGKITNMYVKSTDAKLVSITNRRAKVAIIAKPAVAEKKDKEGTVVQKAKPAVEGQPAVEERIIMTLECSNKDILLEVVERMNNYSLRQHVVMRERFCENLSDTTVESLYLKTSIK